MPWLVLGGLGGVSSNSRYGVSVAGLGDLDDDGAVDFIVGAPLGGALLEGEAVIEGSTLACP